MSHSLPCMSCAPELAFFYPGEGNENSVLQSLLRLYFSVRIGGKCLHQPQRLYVRVCGTMSISECVCERVDVSVYVNVCVSV